MRYVAVTWHWGYTLKTITRPTWSEYFLELAKVVSTRSTCIRRQVGAVIVRDKQILSTGYNGAPSGTEHCTKEGCLREKLGIPPGERYELCKSVHGEQNAIIQAARHGIAIDGADIYVTDKPCKLCEKMIINAGIRNVYVLEKGGENENILEP
jgi:dCMP deaminase